MYLTGFADEVSQDLKIQIKATKELGWNAIESRSIGGTNIHDLDDAAFETVCETLDAAGVRINCFGSTIANWGKKIDDPFEITLDEINRAIPRMQKLGTKLVRIMSYARCAGDDQMAEVPPLARNSGTFRGRGSDPGPRELHELWRHELATQSGAC